MGTPDEGSLVLVRFDPQRLELGTSVRRTAVDHDFDPRSDSRHREYDRALERHTGHPHHLATLQEAIEAQFLARALEETRVEVLRQIGCTLALPHLIVSARKLPAR